VTIDNKAKPKSRTNFPVNRQSNCSLVRHKAVAWGAQGCSTACRAGALIHNLSEHKVADAGSRADTDQRPRFPPPPTVGSAEIVPILHFKTSKLG